MRLQIRSAESSPLQKFGAISKLVVVLDGKTLTFPELIANQDDCRRGKRWHIPAKTIMLNYHHDIRGDGLTDDSIKKIIPLFERAKREYRPQFTSISFTIEKKIALTRDDRFKILELQKKLDTTFIADVEVDRDQNLESFKKELEEFDGFDTKQIRSPTINLRSEARGNFRDKIGYLVKDSRYPRINIQWGGYKDHRENWNSLWEEMLNRRKWCNMVGIIPRKTGRNKPPIRANIAYGLVNGVHTFCFGKSEHRSGKESSFVMRKNWYYEKTGNSHDEDFALSFNVAQVELEGLRKVINRPAFEKHLETRDGLHI